MKGDHMATDPANPSPRELPLSNQTRFKRIQARQSLQRSPGHPFQSHVVMPDTATTVQFIREVFGPLTENPVFISSLPNADARVREPGERHVITRDTAVIADFINKWDRKNRGLFFCVSTLRPSSAPVTAGRSSRSKANIAELALLHADIDLKSVEIGIDEIIARLRSLPL